VCHVVEKKVDGSTPRPAGTLPGSCSGRAALIFLFINFVFQIFSVFIPEMPAGFTSHIVQIIPIYFASFL
jgi:hypothetical protein